MQCIGMYALRLHAVYLVDKQHRVVVADASQNLHNGCEEANMKHWLCKLNAAEMPGAVQAAAATCGAGGTTPVHCAHLEVTETSHLGLPFLIGLRVFNSHHGVASLQEPSK